MHSQAAGPKPVLGQRESVKQRDALQLSGESPSREAAIHVDILLPCYTLY